MERLTKKINGVWDVPFRDENGKFISTPRVIARLAAYENTGLEPEEVGSLDWERRMEEERKLAAMWGYGIDPDRLTDIIDAEKEGRLLVLPCKVGDMVYEHADGLVYAHTLRRIIFDCESIAFDERAIGKSVFLTREEVEAALKQEASTT